MPPSTKSSHPDISQKTAFAQWLTSAGPGALSVLRLTGDDAWKFLSTRFRREKAARNQKAPQDPGSKHTLPENPKPGFASLGILADEKGIGDQVLLVCRRCSPSWELEIQSHHGALVDGHIASVLTQIGFVFLPQEQPFQSTTFTKLEESAPSGQTIVNLWVEKERSLPWVPNRPALIRFMEWVDHWHKGIREILHLLDSQRIVPAIERIEASLGCAKLGHHLAVPYRVAFLGAPNVGKSSLLNKLLGFERALVSQTPGTTRDLVRGMVSRNGWLFELTDSAGIRHSDDPLENEGIRRSLSIGQEVDLLVWLVDPLDSVMPPGDLKPGLFVKTKSDLSGDFVGFPSFNSKNPAVPMVSTSSLSGDGLENLLDRFVEILVGPLPEQSSLVPFTPGLVACLRDLLKLIQTGRVFDARRILSALIEPPS